MDVNKKRKPDQFVEEPREEPVKKKQKEQKDEAKTPHSAENTQEELKDKKEETSHTDKLKSIQEKNHRDSETLNKLRLGITKQKMQVDTLKTQWRNRQRQDKEMKKCFEEVHEHQQMLYEQLCDVNAQLNKAQNWSKVLKRTFGGALEDKKLYSERVNQLKNKLETSNKSVFIAKQQIQKLEETRKVSVETWNQKLQQEGREICELQKMIQSEKQGLDNLTEEVENLRKKLNEAIEQEKVFLEKGKVCQALSEEIQQFKLDLEAKLLERKKLETSLESLRQRKKDIESQVSNFTDEADKMNWALQNKDEKDIEKQITELQQKIENEGQEQTMIRKKISEGEAEIEKTQTILSTILRAQSDNNENIIILKETRRSVTEQIESESIRYNKKEKDNRSHAEEIRPLKEQLENEGRKNDDIAHETNSENETEAFKDAKIAQLTDESKTLELELAETEKENKTVAAEAKKTYSDKKQQTQLKKEATNVKKKVAKNEAKTEELKTMIEILTTDKKIGLKKQSELEQQMKLTDKEIEKLKESIKNEKKEKEAIEQELKKCEAELQKSLEVDVFDFIKEPLVGPTDDLENLLNFDFNPKSMSSPILSKKKSNEEKDKVFSLIDNTIETLKNTNLNVDRSSSLKSKPMFSSSQNSGSQENINNSLSFTQKPLFSSQSAKSQSPKVPAAKTPIPKASASKATSKSSTPKTSTPKSLAEKSLKLNLKLPKSPASGSKTPAENKEPKSILTKKNKFLKSTDKTVTFLSPIVSKSKKQGFF